MTIRNAIASLAVRDIARALGWYERLLARPADSRPMPELGEWKFEGGGWLQLYQGAERAGSGSVTLAVTVSTSRFSLCGRPASTRATP